jgi:hypothetical protein
VGTVTFLGSVSAQAGAGETVTITIVKPDGTSTSVSVMTIADGSFSILYQDVPSSGYKATASIGEDSQYQAANSSQVIFDITKQSRTITLKVTP